MKHVSSLTLAALLAITPPALTGDTPVPEGVEVHFITLKDGDNVTSPVTAIFGLKDMGIAPAGTEREATGQHHILTDRAPLGNGEELTYPLHADDDHKHFDGGRREDALGLSPVAHKLQLVPRDCKHVPHDPPVTSAVITIRVE